MVKNKNEKLNKCNYTVDWGDGTVDHHVTAFETGYLMFRQSDSTHKYVTPGTYTVTVTVEIEEGDDRDEPEKPNEPKPIKKNCYYCKNVLNDCYPPSDDMSYCDDYVEQIEKSCLNCAKFLKECYPPNNYDRGKAKHCSNYKEQK